MARRLVAVLSRVQVRGPGHERSPNDNVIHFNALHLYMYTYAEILFCMRSVFSSYYSSGHDMDAKGVKKLLLVSTLPADAVQVSRFVERVRYRVGGVTRCVSQRWTNLLFSTAVNSTRWFAEPPEDLSTQEEASKMIFA